MDENVLMFSVNDNRWNENFLHYETVVNGVCDAIGLRKKEISFLLTNDEEIRMLNAQYRGKDSATNVLSFESGDDMMLGDVVVSFDTVKNEADLQNKSFENHFAHLILHGVLHLLGYDHVGDVDAKKMEEAEIKILKKMSIRNPYDDEKK